MSKRNKGAKRNTPTTAVKSSATPTADAIESRVVAFAEQLGRLAATVQTKTEGWNRQAVVEQIASIRDGAADLLEQMADGVNSVTGAVKEAEETVVAKAKSLGRSGGVVDAPGKKHRAPMPKDPRATAADAKTSNRRAAKPMAKTGKLRGRG